MQLGIAIDHYKRKGGIAKLQKETRKKLEILESVLEGSHLAHVSINPEDRSEIIMHIAGVDVEVRKIQERIKKSFGKRIRTLQRGNIKNIRIT